MIPRWHEHWTSNKVYDGDMIVLQGQEKIFLSKSKDGSGDVNKQYTKITFTPTQADRFVLAFRNWLTRHGNSQPEWFGTADQQQLPSTVFSKRQVLKLIYLLCTCGIFGDDSKHLNSHICTRDLYWTTKAWIRVIQQNNVTIWIIQQKLEKEVYIAITQLAIERE